MMMMRQRPNRLNRLDRLDGNKEDLKEGKGKIGILGLSPEMIKKIITRSMMGFVMLGGFGLVLWYGHSILALLVILIQVLVFKEMILVRYHAVKEKHIPWFRSINWYFLALCMMYTYTPLFLRLTSRKIGHEWHDFLQRTYPPLLYLLFLSGILVFILSLRRESLKYQMGQWTWTITTLLTVVVQTHFTMQNLFKGIVWLLLPSALIICNDTSAYFCGIALGKKFIKRPLTSLSPNKTWEGFIGAWFFTTVFGFIVSGIISRFEWFVCPQNEFILDEPFATLNCTPDSIFLPTEYNFPWLGAITLIPLQLHSIAFALWASLIAPFGGFYASAIKRAYGIKDFDSILPGHGGFTDRFDCQLTSGLFTWMYIHTIIASTRLDHHGILEEILSLPLSEQHALFTSLNQTLGSL